MTTYELWLMKVSGPGRCTPKLKITGEDFERVLHALGCWNTGAAEIAEQIRKETDTPTTGGKE